jgi:uncharacterized membrane protein
MSLTSCKRKRERERKKEKESMELSGAVTGVANQSRATNAVKWQFRYTIIMCLEFVLIVEVVGVAAIPTLALIF